MWPSSTPHKGTSRSEASAARPRTSIGSEVVLHRLALADRDLGPLAALAQVRLGAAAAPPNHREYELGDRSSYDPEGHEEWSHFERETTSESHLVARSGRGPCTVLCRDPIDRAD